MNWKKWCLTIGASAWLAVATPQFADAAEHEDVFVIYKNDAGKQAIEANATAVVKDFEAFKTIEGTFSDDALRTLKSDANIQVIEKNATTYETAARYTTTELSSITNLSWSSKMTGVTRPWTLGLTGNGVKVGVIDTGVAKVSGMDHVTRLSFVQDNPATSVDEGTIYDTENHGTGVAGIITANSVKDGTNTVVGLAPNADVYSLKVFEGDNAEMSTILSAVEWSIENDITVLNMSLGSSEPDAILERAIQAARAAGIIIIAASGNESSFSTLASVDYPAAYSDVIGVGSVDQQKVRSYFSNVGDTVDFVAPGESLRLLSKSGGIRVDSGTSFAAPHITAMIALLKEKYPTATTAQLQALLKKYSEDLGSAGRDDLYGNGLPNLAALEIDEKLPTVESTPVKPTPGDSDGSGLPIDTDDETIETKSDAQQFISNNQYTITTWLSTIQEGGKIGLRTKFTPLYSLYNDLASPEKSLVKAYNKKIKTVVTSATTKSTKISATNLTKMASAKTTQIRFTTPIKPSTLTANRIVIYRAGKAVSGFKLTKASSGSAIRLTTTKTLAKGDYVIMIDPTTLKTKTSKAITTPFAIKFTVK